MIFEHIEKLKKQYTDKYVVVDESQPELQRFRGLTGAVVDCTPPKRYSSSCC